MSTIDINHTGDTSSDSSRISNVIVVTKITKNDILLGRGAPIINYVGNVSFRALVNTRKNEYNSTGRHQIKDEIARQIVLEVKQRNGRFLRKFDSNEVGIIEAEPAWTIADEDVILEKVKQALRDKEPEKRVAQSQSIGYATNQAVKSKNAVPDRNLPVLSMSENLNCAGLPSLQNSLYCQIALPSIPSRSSYANSVGMLPISDVAGRHKESDLDIILRRQQQHMQHQSPLSNITSVPYPSHEYLHTQLQQNQNGSSTSLSTRTDLGCLPNENLISMLRAEFHRSSNISIGLPTTGMNQQNIDAILLTMWLNRQNRNEAVVGNYSTLGLPNTSPLNLQQYTDAILSRRDHQRYELRGQILLDPLAASWILPPQINSSVPGLSQNGEGILSASFPIGQSPTASLPIGERPNNRHAAAIRNADERLSGKPGDSPKKVESASDARSNTDGRKSNANRNVESSGDSSSLSKRKKKARVSTTSKL